MPLITLVSHISKEFTHICKYNLNNVEDNGHPKSNPLLILKGFLQSVS